MARVTLDVSLTQVASGSALSARVRTLLQGLDVTWKFGGGVLDGAALVEFSGPRDQLERLAVRHGGGLNTEAAISNLRLIEDDVEPPATKTVDVRLLVAADVDVAFLVRQLVQATRGHGAPLGAVELDTECLDAVPVNAVATRGDVSWDGYRR